MAVRCPTCGSEFDSQAALDEHTRSEHGSQQQGTFRCPACGMQFGSQQELDEHTRSEHPG
jgi:uncharacterized C2H2 Zn-finger protein